MVPMMVTGDHECVLKERKHDAAVDDDHESAVVEAAVRRVDVDESESMERAAIDALGNRSSSAVPPSGDAASIVTVAAAVDGTLLAVVGGLSCSGGNASNTRRSPSQEAVT